MAQEMEQKEEKIILVKIANNDHATPLFVQTAGDTDSIGGVGKVGAKFVQFWQKKFALELFPNKVKAEDMDLEDSKRFTEYLEEKLGKKSEEQQKLADAVATRIPDVDIKWKIKRLGEFDSKAGTFFVDGLLMLDWEDKSLELGGKSPDFMEHFWPKVEILAAIPGEEQPNYAEILPKFKMDKRKKGKDGAIIEGPKFGKYRATLTMPVAMTLYARVDFRQFPFDHQTLELSLKLGSIRVPGCAKGTRPTARHPQRWRGASDKKENGHTLTKDCDCLPEYDIVRMCSKAYSSAYGPFVGEARKGATPTMLEVAKSNKAKYDKDKESGKLYQDQYTLQIIVVRDSVSVMWNMCFSLFVIDVMVFAAHGIPMEDLADRLSVNLTLLLTAMAFKWVLSDTLPPVPYLTTMEIYVIATFACLWLQGIAFWFLADLYNYRCDDQKDYWTGENITHSASITYVSPSRFISFFFFFWPSFFVCPPNYSYLLLFVLLLLLSSSFRFKV